jgi:competence protein ComEA
MKFKQLIQDYFTFSRNERKGIIVLVVLIFLLAVTNKLIFYFEKPAKIDAALFDSARHELGLAIDSIDQAESLQKLFAFNPNTIDSVALDSLGIPQSVKNNLLKFRARGGKIHSSADFKKIYGVTDQLYNQVSPYLSLENGPHQQAKAAPGHELFAFDPNKATDSEFLRLGFSDKQIATIRKYLGKSGAFHNKTDFFKIRVISENQKRILSDWVVIEETKEMPSGESPKLIIAQIELNSADSIQLKQLPGIGAVLSKRIVKYRDLLGGFYSIDQLKEVYGLNEQTVQLVVKNVKLDEAKIRKLNLNFADVNELSRHPYLKTNLAVKIVKFRTKYGSIRDCSVLRDSMILNIDEYNRIKPYF